jgi:nicotinamide phosphoribosyltransferase
MKASARCDTNGVWHDVFKDPISDHGKVSKKGRLGLVLDGGIGVLSLRTMPKDLADKRGNVLRKVYRNGELLIEDTFAQIRERAALKESGYVSEIVDRY